MDGKPGGLVLTKALLGILRRLPEDEALVAMFAMRGYRDEQIAETMGVGLPEVMTWIGAARKEIGQELPWAAALLDGRRRRWSRAAVEDGVVDE